MRALNVLSDWTSEKHGDFRRNAVGTCGIAVVRGHPSRFDRLDRLARHFQREHGEGRLPHQRPSAGETILNGVDAFHRIHLTPLQRQLATRTQRKNMRAIRTREPDYARIEGVYSNPCHA